MEKTEDVQNGYHVTSCGRLMTNKVPTIDESTSVSGIEELLHKETIHFDTIHYVYVVNSQRKLKGAISLKEIFQVPSHTLAKDLLPDHLVSVHEHAHQQTAALLALKYGLKEIPVTDSENNFLGAIAGDTLLRIIDTKAVETSLRSGGVIFKNGGFDDVFSLSIITSLKHRLPWLLVGLIGGLAGAGIVDAFEKVISHTIILAAFIPLIVYIADAVGTQMEAFIIRDLTIKPGLNFLKYFGRQSLIISLIGGILGALLYALSFLIYRNILMSGILAIALFAATISALITGLIVPYIFSKLKLDPANASGPIATIIQDILSVSIYLAIASALI